MRVAPQPSKTRCVRATREPRPRPARLRSRRRSPRRARNVAALALGRSRRLPRATPQRAAPARCSGSWSERRRRFSCTLRSSTRSFTRLGRSSGRSGRATRRHAHADGEATAPVVRAGSRRCGCSPRQPIAPCIARACAPPTRRQLRWRQRLWRPQRLGLRQVGRRARGAGGEGAAQRQEWRSAPRSAPRPPWSPSRRRSPMAQSATDELQAHPRSSPCPRKLLYTIEQRAQRARARARNL